VNVRLPAVPTFVEEAALPSDTGLKGRIAPPAIGVPGATIELSYRTLAEIARDRLPQLPLGLLARTQAEVATGDVVDVLIEAKADSITVRARGEIRWVTRLATSRLVGMTLAGATDADRERLITYLDAPSGLGAAMTPALTPALGFAHAPVLAVAMLQPNAVLRQILAAALEKVPARLGERWSLKLEASASTDGFLTSMSSRPRQLAVIDCDALPDAGDALVGAVRAHAGYERLPLLLLSGRRTARLEDRYAVTMQKPLAVKSFLHTTELLLRA
jgi:hypothetical protein